MVPLKTKIIRRKALSKAIMIRLRLRSKCNKWQSRENVLAFRENFLTFLSHFIEIVAIVFGFPNKLC